MTLTRSGAEIAEYFAEAMGEAFAAGAPAERDGGALRPRYNVAPSQPVLTVVPHSAEAGSPLRCGFEWRRWGLVPEWADDPSIGQRMFNARSESVAEKPSFRAAYRRRRCLVVADGFYEWTPRPRGHRPFYFTAADASLLCFAGLYEHWRGTRDARATAGGDGPEQVESCTVLTTEANPDLAGIHHRMPLLLAPRHLATWLDPATPRHDLDALLDPAPAGTLRGFEVGRFVNDPRHDDPACLRAAEAEPASAADGPGRDEGDDAQGLLFGAPPRERGR